MKLYKLKKDLPTFKAGEIFDISSNGNLVKRGECISDCVVAYSAATLEKFPNILKDWFEEIPEEPKTVCDLEDGDECWMLDLDLEPLKIEWSGTPYDIRLRELGRIYLTKEELEKQVAWEEARQTLLRDTKGFKPDWTDGNDHYEVYYDRYVDKLDIGGCSSVCTHHDLWFATREDALASIKAHPDQWKTYLGVEE